MYRQAFTLILVGLSLYLCSPLLLPVAMGAVVAVLFFPWLIKLERRRVSTSLASGILSVGVTLLIGLPTVTLIILGARAGLGELRHLRDIPVAGMGGNLFEKLIDVPVIHQIVEHLNQAFAVETYEIVTVLGEASKSLALSLADVLGGFLTQIPSYLMGLGVMLVSTFFFLVDGRKLATFIRRNSFFDENQTESLIQSFVGTCRSVILAAVASGFAQSVVFGFACLVTGRPNQLLIGFLVFIASFVPLIGAVPVTVGVALHAFLTGDRSSGIILLVFALIASVLDNFIRPAILKGSANLHPLLAFVAVFGGLQMIGFSGVFLGPIVAALAVAAIRHLSKKPLAVVIRDAAMPVSPDPSPE